MWSRLTEIYGRRFTNEYGPNFNDTWGAAIAGLTDQQVIDGFANLAEEGKRHPPNMYGFVDACTSGRPGDPYKPTTLPYGIREAMMSAVAAGCDPMHVQGKSMDELWEMEIEARTGHRFVLPK